MMWLRMRTWFQASTVLAVVCIGWISVYKPSSSQIQSQPAWMEENTNGSFQHALDMLQEPAPRIISSITIEQAMQIVSSYYPTRVDGKSLAEENISDRECFSWPTSHSDQTLESWLESNLSRFDLTFTIKNGEIVIINRDQETRMTRSYPCPAVDSTLLTKALEAIGPDWVSKGGDEEITFIDTNIQSLIVVTGSYSTHRKIENILNSLNATAGVGWRMDGPTWTRLPRAILGRLSEWIEPSSRSPTTPAAPATGIGCTAGNF